MVELIKFEPVTLARLDCIPTRRMGTRKEKFKARPLFQVSTPFYFTTTS